MNRMSYTQNYSQILYNTQNIGSFSSWIANPFILGDKKKAAERIMKAFYQKEKILNLSELGLNQLPDCLGELTELKKLDLKGNQLTSLPPEIGNLQQLTVLLLSGNQLTSLPPEIGNLQQLTELDLWGNQLTSLPQEIGNLQQLTKLDLFANFLKSLPQEIGDLQQLTELNLGKNRLSLLPPEIGNLQKLTKLNLFANELSSLPQEISNLQRLTQLVLNGNLFTSLPQVIGNLQQLTELDLNVNELTSLPQVIGNLQRLTELNLGRNKLTSLPQVIGNLQRLTKLDLNGNQLTSLPQEISNLQQLMFLIIEENPNLENLPLSLGQIPALVHFSIEGTRISDEIRCAILDQCQALRNKASLQTLPLCLEKWRVASKEEFTFPIEILSDEQKFSLYEWLVRLERSKEFKESQTSLAKKVCAIVHDMLINSDFRQLFFSQVEANLEDCSDRAEAAFFELYVSWAVSRIPSNSTLKEKIEHMARGARSIALEQAIAIEISKQGSIEQESSEIYLFYEISLQKELDLLEVIHGMSYEEIGKRDWMNTEWLKKYVQENYLDILISLPIFEKVFEVVKKSDQYQGEFSVFSERMENSSQTDSELLDKGKDQKEQYEIFEKNFKENWVRENLGLK